MVRRTAAVKKEGLIRVEDPEETLAVACDLKDASIDWKKFRDSYGRKYRVLPKKTCQDHLAFLVELNLLREGDKAGQFKSSDLLVQVCDSLKLKSSPAGNFASLMKTILLDRSVKGERFREFFWFVRTPRTDSELIKEFRRQKGTLLQWLDMGKLVVEDSEGRWVATDLEGQLKAASEFWGRLKAAYLEERRNLWSNKREGGSKGLPGTYGMFVPISRLHSRLYPVVSEPGRFDVFLRELLEDPRYRVKIELAGAPPVQVERMNLRPFPEKGLYNQRRYYYLALHENL